MTRRDVAGGIAIAGFILTIWMANYAVQRYGFVTIAPGIAAPAGVWCVGLSLVLRDAAQQLLGRLVTLPAIVVGALLSYSIAPSLAEASAAAFLLSELADFAVFTPLQRRGWTTALAVSAAVGAVIDSVVFLQIAFGSLAFLEGQIVGKLTMVMLAVALSAALRPRLLADPA